MPKVSAKAPRSRSTAGRALMTPVQQILNESNVDIAQDDSSGSDLAFSGSSTRDERAGTTTTMLPTIISQSSINRSNQTLQMSTGGHEAAIHVAGQSWSAPFYYDTSAAFDRDSVLETHVDNRRARLLLRNRDPFTGEVQGNAEGAQVPSAPNSEGASGAGSSRATSLSQAFSTASEGDVMELQPAIHSCDGAATQLHIAKSSIPLGQLDRGKFPLARRPTKQHLRVNSRPDTDTLRSPSACSSTATAMKPSMIARGLAISRAADEHTCNLSGQGKHTGHPPLHTSSEKSSSGIKEVASGSVCTRQLPHASPTKKERSRPKKAEKTDASPHLSGVGLLQRRSANAAAVGQGRSAVNSVASLAIPRYIGTSSELDNDGNLAQQASLRRAFSFWLSGFTMAVAGSISLSRSFSLLNHSPLFLPLVLAKPRPQPYNAFCGTLP